MQINILFWLSQYALKLKAQEEHITMKTLKKKKSLWQCIFNQQVNLINSTSSGDLRARQVSQLT